MFIKQMKEFSSLFDNRVIHQMSCIHVKWGNEFQTYIFTAITRGIRLQVQNHRETNM